VPSTTTISTPTTAHPTTSTDVVITRENAIDVNTALVAEQQQLRVALDATTDPAERARLFRRATTNAERQALTWERRPGRTRDKQPPANQCRWQARLCTAAAEIENLRAHAATPGRSLPDPRGLLAGIHDEPTAAALIVLYTAAADATAPTQ